MNIGVMTATLAVQTTDLGRASQAMTSFEQKVLASMNRINASVGSLGTKLAEAGKRTPVITPVVDEKPAVNSLGNFSTSLAATAQRLRTFGYLASIVLTAPMVLFAKTAFKAAEDFEYSMQKIVGLVGVSQRQVDDWSKALLKLGPALGKTPEELANALYFITSAGHKGADALDILTISAKAAEAGLGETKDVAEFAVSAMNSYRATNLTAANAVDVLIAAVREGKMETTTFSNAIKSILPIAASLNLPLGQVAGAMAAMSLQGATAANSATYLRGVLNSLMKIQPSNAAGKA